MSTMGKGLIFVSRMGYGVDDSEIKLNKKQNLVQDFLHLQKENDVMRSKLEAAKQKKRVLAAEVRFLRKRYKYLMETKGMDKSSEEKRQVQPLKSEKQLKTMNEHLLSRNAATQHRLPPLPVQKKSTKGHYVAKKVFPPFANPVATGQRLTKLLHGKQTIVNSLSSVSILGHHGRMLVGNDTIAARKSLMDSDLNQGSGSSFLTRAPVFDLNEISAGDDDFQNSLEAVNIKEGKSLRRGLNEEEQQQSDLTLSVCRNSDEGSSRAGKRKISWQDPLALRV